MKNIGGILLALIFLIIALEFLPRILAQVAASNAALNAQYDPNAAWRRAQSQWIGAAGNVGTDLIGNLADRWSLTQ